MSRVQPAGARNVQRRRRIDRPLLDYDLALVQRELWKAGELQRYAGGAVRGVVRVMLMGAAALHMSWRAPRRAGLGRRCQKRGYALGRQREEGGQNENTRTGTAELAQHAGHGQKLVKGRLAVTTRERMEQSRSELRTTPGKRSETSSGLGGLFEIYVPPWISTCARRAPWQ